MEERKKLRREYVEVMGSELESHPGFWDKEHQVAWYGKMLAFWEGKKREDLGERTPRTRVRSFEIACELQITKDLMLKYFDGETRKEIRKRAELGPP
jgi:hypothetical protein